MIATITNCTSYGAAIGNGYDRSDPVDITITGGTVTATLENSTTASGAAIGSGADSTPGKILIAGGTVTAKNESSNSSAAAIGGGNNQNCTFIAIIGGTVTATAPMNAIGGGIFASGSVVSKGGTYIQLTTAVTATSTGTATSTPTNGIKYNENGYFEVYGDPVLDASIAIGDVKLLVPEASSLKLGGANNAGTIFVAGTLLDGNGNIYYRINFEENTTKATATADTDVGVMVFQGATYALPGIQVSLSGYDQWYLGDTELTGNTFTMPASTVTIKGHTHTLNYSGRTQRGHVERCSGCDYLDQSAGHDFTNGECPCSCLQTTYVVPKGDPATVVGLPVPIDGIMTGTSDTNGWYILRDEKALGGTSLTVTGNVNLVLEDGATVITNGNMGIKLSDSASLTIWGQTGNTGSLNIKEGIVGLGTNSLTINGGKVNVLDIAPPIKFPVTVNGGELNMPKQNTAIQSSLTVTGGKAIITCSSGNAFKGNVTVSGGEATVTSTGYLANAIEGNVIVSGGEATVTSNSGNAIEGNVTVSGSGKLTAKSEASKDSERFAIYNANMTDGKVEVKDNGQLTAQSNYDAIYSGHVLLSGGTLEATGKFSGVDAGTIDADGGTLKAEAEISSAILGNAIYVRGATVEATVDSSNYSTYAIHATTMEVTDGNVTAKTTNISCTGIDTEKGLTVTGGTVNAVSEKGTAIRGSITLEGGKVEAEGTFGIYAVGGTVNVSGGELMAEAVIYASNVNVSGTGIVTAKSGIEGSVNVSGGSLTAESGKSHGIFGNATVSGGTVKLITPERNGISRQLTITGGWVEANSVQTVIAKSDENGNGNGILITKEIKDLNSSQLSSGLIQLGSDPAKVYGTPVFNQNLTTGENEILKSIHIPEKASLTMAQGNTLTNNGHIYLDVGGSLGTDPVADSTGKVYYQVKLGDGVSMQGDRAFVGSSAYAIGSVTFSGGTDGYFVRDIYTSTGSLGTYQSGSDYTIVRPITVSAHTHAFDENGDCSCSTHVTVKVTMGQAESYYGSLATALEAIGDQEATITLLDDTKGTITIAGGNLTIQGDKGIESILVTGGSVEITGGKIGTLNVQGGTVNLSGGSFGTISSSGGVVALLEEGFAFQLEDGSWLDGFNGSDTNTLSGGTVCPVPLKNAQLTGPSSITYGDSKALTFTVVVNNQSANAPALSWTRDGEALTVTGSSCSLSDWDVSRGADNTVQSYTVTCTASLEGYCLTGKHTITIDPKTLTIEWSDTQFTYDGQAHNPTVSSGVSGISLTLTQAQTNAGSYLAQVTGIQGDKAGNYQLPTAVTQSFTIAPAAITGMTLEKTSVVYNGTAQEPAIKEVKAGELTLSSGDYELSVSPETVQNAGTYQVTVSGKGNFTGSAKTDYSITKAQPTVASDELAITYGTKLSGCDLSGFTASFQGSKLPGSFAFEKPDAMPRVADSDSTEYQLTFTPEDLVNYQTVSMKVKLTVNAKALTVDAAVENKQYDGTNKASYVSGKPVLVGLVDGDAVEFSHGQPYFKSVEVNPSIEILFTEEFAISGEDSSNYTLTQPAVTASIYNSFTAACGTEYTVNADGWQNTDFVVTAKDGFTLSQTNAAGDENWTKNLTVTQEGTGKLGFYVRNAAGAISQLVEEEYWIDKSAPSGTIRFDGTDVTESSPVAVYKNKDVAVTLEGSDALSKVSSVSYLVSDKAMTETELKAVANWTEAKALTITAEDGATKYVYAKVADNAGNVAYLRANYIIFDTTAPSITGVENGKTYYTTQTATITDTNLDSVTLNGNDATSPITLEGNMDATHIIVATDKAGNSTTITVTMKPISSITDPFKNLTGETVTKDDRKNLEDAADTLKGLIDATDDEDEKQKLQDGLDMVEGLLKVLDQVEDVESILEALPDSVAPDADDDTVQNIKDARKAVDQLSEHQQSLVDERLKEKLARLENELKDYQFESGADSTWIRGSGMGLQFVANGRLDKLEKVLLNGEALSADDFTKGSPKTTIVLQAVLLESLENGEHTLELVYSNGKVEAEFTVMQGTNYLELTDVSAFDGQTEVEVNGISYPIQELDGKRYVMLPETGDLLTTYTYRNGSNENTHDNYPTGMRVFRINRSASGTTVTELAELADLLQYSGCSIRVTGNRGIRMITSLEQGKKAAFTGAGLAGFTLEEYGTVVTWASDLGEGDLNLNSGKHNFAYKRGVADPVFGTSGNLTQYTNVLVDFSLEECSKDIVMRPYIILKDATGNQHTLYGGHVTRSISYIAWQNRDTYQPGTAAYDYVHELMGNTAAG